MTTAAAHFRRLSVASPTCRLSAGSCLVSLAESIRFYSRLNSGFSLITRGPRLRSARCFSDEGDGQTSKERRLSAVGRTVANTRILTAIHAKVTKRGKIISVDLTVAAAAPPRQSSLFASLCQRWGFAPF